MKTAGMIVFCLLVSLLRPAGIRAEETLWRLGPEPQNYRLDNGLSVVWQRDNAAANSVVLLLVRGGDRDDPPGRSGLAYLTGRLALEIPDQTKLQQLMGFGSTISLAVGGDYSLITIRSLSRYLEPTLAIMTKILTNPLFSEMRIDGAKDVMRHLQKMETDNPTEFMRKILGRIFFGASAYGAALFGDEASLAQIGKKDIQSFFRSHYVAGNTVSVVISDLGEEIIKPLIAGSLGSLPAGPGPPSRPVSVQKPESPQLTMERQSAQTHISISVLLPELTADNFILASLLETWLGKGIGSRLWPLRSRGDLAYGLNAELTPNKEAMLLSVYLQTGSKRSAEAQAELARLLHAVHENGIGAAELSIAKAYARADFWRENESRERRAATLAFLEGSGLSYRLAGDFTERLEKIGLAEFNQAIREWLAPERWFSLHIGPAAE
jgi:zinc protease